MYLSLLPYEFLSLHSTLCVSRSYEARDDFTRVALSRNIVQNDIAWFSSLHVHLYAYETRQRGCVIICDSKNIKTRPSYPQ